MDCVVNVGIFLNHAQPHTGPGKVAINLLKGFKEIGVDFRINDIGVVNGCLQPVPNLNTLPLNTLIGPNIMVLPSEMPYIWERYKNYVVPCEWVKKKYASFQQTKNCNLNVWPVGIDTDKFKESNNEKKFDCLIYYKNRGKEKLKEAEDKLKSLGISYKTIGYGSYTEEQFLDLLSKCKWSLLLTKTESQGIAYMEILSTNTPCYVWDKERWDDIKPYNFKATSAPYFDTRCGIKHKDLSKLSEFIDRLENFQPREYILENFTLKKCASEYISLLK